MGDIYSFPPYARPASRFMQRRRWLEKEQFALKGLLPDECATVPTVRGIARYTL